MEFLQTTGGLLIFSLVGLLLFCVILYYVIKLAVSDAIKDSRKDKAINYRSEKPIPASIWNAAQIALKNKYEKGEITIEEYNKEWNKL